MTRKTLLTNGDSWTFGSEIMAPEFMLPESEQTSGRRYIPGVECFMKCNDYYRIPRIWSSYLGEILDANVVNLSMPARSNDTIYDTTIHWIMKNYIHPGKDTSDLTVVIGWSSPERKNIIISESVEGIERASWFTLWPMMNDTQYYSSPVLKEFFKFYVAHQWAEQEYIKRFIEQNFQLQNFFKIHKIKYYFFNSFYAHHNKGPEEWEDISLTEIVNNWDNLSIGWGDPMYDWDTIKDSLLLQWWSIENFILQDQGSFRTHIWKNIPEEIRMCNWHPSPESHKSWAQYLSKFMT